MAPTKAKHKRKDYKIFRGLQEENSAKSIGFGWIPVEDQSYKAQLPSIGWVPEYLFFSLLVRGNLNYTCLTKILKSKNICSTTKSSIKVSFIIFPRVKYLARKRWYLNSVGNRWKRMHWKIREGVVGKPEDYLSHFLTFWRGRLGFQQ